jgi:hypothetical protein
LAQELEQLRAAGQDVAYPRVSLTVLENFIPWADQELRVTGKRQPWHRRRAEFAVADLDELTSRLKQQVQDASAGRLRLPEVPRWTGQQRPRINGSSFVGPVAFPNRAESATTTRPIFFVGYGHFDQCRKDIEKFPGYGVNLIQSSEWGVDAIYPKPDVVSDEKIKLTLDTLDRARRAGVAVDLLLSVHYFPRWMVKKHPHLDQARHGFIGYSIYAPEAREFLRQYVRRILPPLKDHPALLSICLTNEPTNVEEPSEHSRRAWHAWLRGRYGDVAALNRAWRTDFANLEAVHLPNPIGESAEKRPSPHWSDWVRFNQEWFAEFHTMLADAVHEIAPDLPVHAKAQTWQFYHFDTVANGIDPLLFANFSNINGNDSPNLYNFSKGEGLSTGFAQSWQEQATGYQLLRSVKDAPVFNSENHVILDRETRHVPAAHVRAALWQGAVHGQSATTIWAWERESDPDSDLAGSIMERPACAEMVGIVSHDLNRLSLEMTQLQKLPPRVVLLQSISAATWDGRAYHDALRRTHTALSFTGLKLGFITERQLEQKTTVDAPVLIIAGVNHLSDAAYEALTRYEGQIIGVGDATLVAKNEFGRQRPKRSSRLQEAIDERVPFKPDSKWPTLWEALLPRLAEVKVAPPVRVLAKGEPQRQVQWLCTGYGDHGLILNLYNSADQAATISVAAEPSTGLSVSQEQELISRRGDDLAKEIVLQPMEVRLYHLK